MRKAVGWLAILAKGVVHKVYPDYLVRLKNGAMLVLEVVQNPVER